MRPRLAVLAAVVAAGGWASVGGEKTTAPPTQQAGSPSFAPIQVQHVPVDVAVHVGEFNDSLHPSAHGQGSTVTIVLLDPLGPTAKAHLWPALFALHLSLKEPSRAQIRVLAASGERTGSRLTSTVRSAVERRSHLQHGTRDWHDEDITTFESTVSPITLDTPAHYNSLCDRLNEEARDGTEVGRVFYLPEGVGARVTAAVEAIGAHCTPKHGAWLRVALEGPLGTDLASARSVDAVLRGALAEGQLFRVDPTLGRPGVQQIYDFRDANGELDNLLCSDFVEKVEIVAAERKPLGERAGTHETAGGVMRTVLQPRLTQILALLSIDLDHIFTPDVVPHEKAHFLETVPAVKPSETKVYQYAGYTDDCRDSLGNASFDPTAATLAVTTLWANSERWRGVPFHLLAGTGLQADEEYVRVQFGKLPVLGGAMAGAATKPSGGDKSQMLINLQDRGKWPVGVLLGLNVGGVSGIRLRIPKGWSTAHRSSLAAGSGWVGNVFLPEPTFAHDAPYEALLHALYHGDRSKFVGGDAALESWRVWDAVVQDGALETTTHEQGLDPATLLRGRAKNALPGLHDEL